MRDVRAVMVWVVAALLVGLGTTACAPKVTRRQTEIMEKVGKVSVSAVVLRVRVNDLADRFAGRIEEAADRIEGESRAVDARRRAALLKVDVIPAVYTAGYRVDPLAAAIDVWVLTYQFSAYVHTGAGRDLFGAQQPLLAGHGPRDRCRRRHGGQVHRGPAGALRPGADQGRNVGQGTPDCSTRSARARPAPPCWPN